MPKNKNKQRETKTTGAPKKKPAQGSSTSSTSPAPRRHVKAGHAGSARTSQDGHWTKLMDPKFHTRMVWVPRDGGR